MSVGASLDPAIILLSQQPFQVGNDPLAFLVQLVVVVAVLGQFPAEAFAALSLKCLARNSPIRPCANTVI